MTMTMTVRSETELRAALDGAQRRLTVTRPSMLIDLAAWRERCARAGKELVADSDAPAELVALISQHPLVSEIVGELATHGLSVRLLAASYAPAPRDRERMSTWLVTEDADEGPVLHVGLTRQARPGAVAVELARTATLIDEQPVVEHPLGVQIVDAVRQSYALRWAGVRGNREEALRCRDALGRQIARARLRGGMDEDDVNTCALRLWAIVTGMDSVAALSQIGRIDEQVAQAARALLAIAPQAPASPQEMQSICSTLAAGL